MSKLINNSDFNFWIEDIKSKIRSSQIKAALSINKELISLYWQIGKSINDKIKNHQWGSSVVEKLSSELRKTFPHQTGFSRSNLFSMKKFYEFYHSSDLSIKKIQQLVGQIPWGHQVTIITKSSKVEEALFYCNKTIQNNWSRSILLHQIASKLFERTGKAIPENLESELPSIEEIENELKKM